VCPPPCLDSFLSFNNKRFLGLPSFLLLLSLLSFLSSPFLSFPLFPSVLSLSLSRSSLSLFRFSPPPLQAHWAALLTDSNLSLTFNIHRFCSLSLHLSTRDLSLIYLLFLCPNCTSLVLNDCLSLLKRREKNNARKWNDATKLITNESSQGFWEKEGNCK